MLLTQGLKPPCSPGPCALPSGRSVAVQVTLRPRPLAGLSVAGVRWLGVRHCLCVTCSGGAVCRPSLHRLACPPRARPSSAAAGLCAAPAGPRAAPHTASREAFRPLLLPRSGPGFRPRDGPSGLWGRRIGAIATEPSSRVPYRHIRPTHVCQGNTKEFYFSTIL